MHPFWLAEVIEYTLDSKSEEMHLGQVLTPIFFFKLHFSKELISILHEFNLVFLFVQ